MKLVVAALRPTLILWWRASGLASPNEVPAATLPSRPQFQALEPRGDVQTDLTLQAEWLQRDRIVRPADQEVAASTDADRRAALRARVVAGEIARPKPRDWRVDAPGECGFLGDA